MDQLLKSVVDPVAVSADLKAALGAVGFRSDCRCLGRIQAAGGGVGAAGGIPRPGNCYKDVSCSLSIGESRERPDKTVRFQALLYLIVSQPVVSGNRDALTH